MTDRIRTVKESKPQSAAPKSDDAGCEFSVQYLGWLPCDGVYGAEFVTPILNKSAWLTQDTLKTIEKSKVIVRTDGLVMTRSHSNALSAVSTEPAPKSKEPTKNGKRKPEKTLTVDEVVLDWQSIAYVQLGEVRLTDFVALVRLGYSEETKRVAHVHVFKCDDAQQAFALCSLVRGTINSTEHLQHVRNTEKDAYQKTLVTKCSDALFKELSERTQKQPVNEQVILQNGKISDELQSRLHDTRHVLLLPPRDYDEEQRRQGRTDLAITDGNLAERRSASRSKQSLDSRGSLSDVNNTLGQSRSSLLATPTPARSHNRTRSDQHVPSPSVLIPPRDYDERDEELGGIYGQVTLRKPLPSGTWAQHVSVQRDLVTMRHSLQPVRANGTIPVLAPQRELN